MAACGKRDVRLEVGADDLFGKGFFAIFALHAHVAPHFAHAKAALHRLGMADAIGVGAGKDAADALRQAEQMLLHHLEVLDDVHRGIGRKQG